MKYTRLTEKNLSDVVRAYIAYYNNCEDGCWTYEKAYKRIHQVMAMEDAENCLLLLKWHRLNTESISWAAVVLMILVFLAKITVLKKNGPLRSEIP